MESEINWNVHKRWNLVGFTGMGSAFSSFEDFNKGKSAASIGTGFRYLLARKFGMQREWISPKVPTISNSILQLALRDYGKNEKLKMLN